MTALERRTVGSLALLYSFRMLGLFMVLPLLALYAADMPGASPALLGLALGIYGLTQALLQIPLGWLSDRIGRKPVILAGLALIVLGSVVAAQAESVQGIVLGRALQGAGAIASTVMALLSDLTREDQRTKAMALMGGSIGISFALALVLGPIVASLGGLSAVFWFTAALSLVGVVIVLLLVPEPGGSLAQYGEVSPQANLLGPVLRNAALAQLNFGIFVLHFVLMATFLLVPGLLEGTAAVSREDHWMVYFGVLACSVLVMIPMLARAERGGHPRQMFLLALGLMFVGVAALALQMGAWGLYAALWLLFIGFNYLEATLPSLVSKTVFAGGRGTALGVYSTSQFLGIFGGGVAGGWVQQWGGLLATLAMCLVLIGIWWLISLLTRAAIAAPS